MGPVVGEHWKTVFSHLDFAFQPICNLHTGSCYGYEALVRGWDAHFGSVHEMLDAAFAERQIFQLDLELRALAIAKFIRLPNHGSAKLFMNVDNRVMEMADYHPGETNRMLAEHGIASSSVCFEISERHRVSAGSALMTVGTYRDQHFRIALDDFGTGFSGLQMLYETQPDFVKVDRFFIGGANTDSRKSLFVKHVVDMAHLLGISVIAEGAETEEELHFCREIGCDLVQGYFVQRPTTELADLRESYPHLAELAQNDRRSKAMRLRSLPVEYVEPVGADDRVDTLIERFKGAERPAYVAVVEGSGEPLGIVTEQTMRPYMYSQYGWSLLTGPSGRTIRELVTRTVTCDVHAGIQDALGLFSVSTRAQNGIVVTDNGCYAGILAPSELLSALHEFDLESARDSNPLTRLPGNALINEHFRGDLADRDKGRAFVYFDFDQFKPFNDLYGFRVGDRAIQVFGDLLRSSGAEKQFFVGHVGGDDFIASIGLVGRKIDEVVALVSDLCERFAQSAASLHSAQDRDRGCIMAPDRDGVVRRFGLLGVSAGVLEIPSGELRIAVEDIPALLGAVKRRVKSERLRVLHERLTPSGARVECIAIPRNPISGFCQNTAELTAL
ncbi:MAG: GGDEF domain-containing protein [Coriobacteriia bacterium]|nr:GGDEF domain-containing protein [Coriobacteriia bacterium]